MGKRIQLDIVYRPKKGAQCAPRQTAADVIKSAVASVDFTYPEKRASEYAEAFNSPAAPTTPKADIAQSVERKFSKLDVAGSTPAVRSKPKKPRRAKANLANPIAKKRGRPSTNFDRKAYMRIYMGDKRKADAAGITVKEWRRQNAKVPMV